MKEERKWVNGKEKVEQERGKGREREGKGSRGGWGGVYRRKRQRRGVGYMVQGIM